MTPAQHALTTAVGEQTTGPYNAYLRSPALRAALQPVRAHLRNQPNIPLDVQELAILVVARHWNSRAAFAAHIPLARSAGLGEAVITALAEQRPPANLSVVQAAVFDVCDHLLRDGVLPDNAFEAAVTAITEQGLVDLIGLIGFYSTTCLVLNVDEQRPAGAPPF